jgi:pilus assembly protein Flp/PilA
MPSAGARGGTPYARAGSHENGGEAYETDESGRPRKWAVSAIGRAGAGRRRASISVAVNELRDVRGRDRRAWHSRCDMAAAWCGIRRAHVNQDAAAPQQPHRQDAVRICGGVMSLINYVKSFARNEEGQDLLEYALLVALIALVAIVAVEMAGTSVSDIFQRVANELAGAA